MSLSPSDTEKLLSILHAVAATLPTVQLNTEQSLHHIGVYGHHCGIWSPSPSALSFITGPFHITAAPKYPLSLGMLPPEQQRQLTATLTPLLICDLINTLPWPTPATPQGIVWQPTSIQSPDAKLPDDELIVLFDPLRDLQLLDITPVKADTSGTTR